MGLQRSIRGGLGRVMHVKRNNENDQQIWLGFARLKTAAR